MKWISAIQLGVEILSDIELLLAGQTTQFTFSWHGKKFNVTIAQ